ncbi:MAG: hypothetical protein WC428_00810 [Candidatus Paceibacterota bacterium]
MSIIREKIKFNSSGSSLNISLGSNSNFIEYQQDIDRLTQFTGLDLVNPVIDGEERRFKLNPTPNAVITLKFQFYASFMSAYDTSGYGFIAAGFTYDEIHLFSANLLNSFFILDFYDTFDINNQTKIFTTYLTKLTIPPTSYLPEYTIGASTNNQLYRWYVPLSYFTGSTMIGYVKFSFFNAKTGKVTLFFNEDNDIAGIQETPMKIFFKTQLDITNMTWKFITTSYPIIKAKEVINNTLYINKVNNTIVNKDNLQQNPPSGTTYDYKTNTYLII